MGSDAKTASPSVPFQEYIDRQMRDPEFAKIHEEQRPEFELMEQLIALRIKRKMTQAELAKRVGTTQPSIARLENRGHTSKLDFLRRVAEALDARVEIRLVPKEIVAGEKVRAIAAGTHAEYMRPYLPIAVAQTFSFYCPIAETPRVLTHLNSDLARLSRGAAGSASSSALVVQGLIEDSRRRILSENQGVMSSDAELFPIKLNEEVKAANV